MTEKEEIVAKLEERMSNAYDGTGMCRKCGERFLTKEEKVQHLLKSTACAVYAGAVSVDYPEQSAAEGAAIAVLDNEMFQADRFGQGIKDGKLYYGFPVADAKGEWKPEIMWGGKPLYGAETLEAHGFSISPDFAYVEPKAWDKREIKRWLLNPRPSKSTRELFEELLKINRASIHHDDDAKHIIACAYAMLTYIYSAFPVCPRLLIHGLAESGKSMQTDVIAAFSCNPLPVSDASKSSIFRMVEARAGLVAIDNFDNRSDEEKKNLIDLYDTSYEEGRATMRTEDTGKKKRPTIFRTYCPLSLNCVSTAWMPQSSISRTIFIPMYKKSASVKLESFRDFPEEKKSALRHELRLWGMQRHADIVKLAHELYTGLSNRDEEISRSLLAILKDAGDEHYGLALAYLKKNFEERHVEEDFSDDNTTLLCLWEIAYEACKKATLPSSEVRVCVGDVAEPVLKMRGISRSYDDGKPNPRFSVQLAAESRRISSFFRGLPYLRTTMHNGRRYFHFNVAKLQELLEARGLMRPVEDENGQVKL